MLVPWTDRQTDQFVEETSILGLVDLTADISGENRKYTMIKILPLSARESTWLKLQQETNVASLLPKKTSCLFSCLLPAQINWPLNEVGPQL